MKLGIYISPRHRVPPNEQKILAPWYLAFDLANGLVDRGHDVYLFAAKTSETKAKLIDAGIEPTFPMRDKMTKDEYRDYIKRKDEIMISKMIDTAVNRGIKVLHINQLEYVYELIKNASKDIKFIISLHDPITEEKYSLMKELDLLPNCYFVSISNSQRNSYPFKFIQTIYHGVNLKDYEFDPEPSDYILHMGRLVPEKGLDEAIQVALSQNIRLEIGTDFHDGEKTEYFEKSIKPYLKNPLIGEPGIVDGSNKILLYKKAKALLFPIKWEEPFGMVLIEAMACGTPVVAYNRGSVPEIVRDGETGFIINSDLSNLSNLSDLKIQTRGLGGLKEAVERINDMPKDEYLTLRENCRKHIEENFTTGKMVENYEKVYKQVLE